MDKYPQMRKWLTVGIILLFVAIAFSSVTNARNEMILTKAVTSGISTEKSLTLVFCFGSIDNITFNEHMLSVISRNLICIQYDSFRNSWGFSYSHYKYPFGFSYGLNSFVFHGTLKPHFICGYFISNTSSNAIAIDINSNQDIGKLGLFFSREIFLGNIENLVINGSDYRFDAVNLRYVDIWWDTGSRGIRLGHYLESSVSFFRNDYVLKGILRPDFICAIGRYIWNN